MKATKSLQDLTKLFASNDDHCKKYILSASDLSVSKHLQLSL